MHKSEPRANPTLINCVNKVHELDQGPLGLIGQYRLPYNPILKLIQYLIIERINYTLVPYVNNNETQSAWVCDLLSIACSLFMNWYL